MIDFNVAANRESILNAAHSVGAMHVQQRMSCQYAPGCSVVVTQRAFGILQYRYPPMMSESWSRFRLARKMSRSFDEILATCFDFPFDMKTQRNVICGTKA